MFLSIPINKFIEVSSKKTLIYTICVLLFMSMYLGWIHEVEFVKDGYNLFNFILLYLIGRYLKLYPIGTVKRYYYLLVFIASSACTAILSIGLDRFWGEPYRAVCYNSPFVIIAAVSLFLYFTRISFTSKAINYLSASCLSIYLFQDGCFNFYRKIKELYLSNCSTTVFFLYLLLFFAISIILPLIIDKIRLLVFGKLENKASSILDRKFFQKYITE